MVFQFGEISFEPLTAPSDISIDRGVNLSEQERLMGGPTLQDVGGVLTRIEMSISLHVSLGDVRERLSAFISMMQKKEPKPFINGAGFSEGDFVISNLRYQIEQTDKEGRLLAVSLSASLKEYLESEPEDREALAARKAAVATITANPIIVKPTVKYQTPKSLTMREITSGVAAAGTAADAGKKAASIPDLAKKYVNQATQALVTARDKIVSARQRVDGIEDDISNAVQLKNSLDQSLTTINQMYDLVTDPSPDLPAIGGHSQMLESNIDSIMLTSAQLATLTSLRR